MEASDCNEGLGVSVGGDTTCYPSSSNNSGVSTEFVGETLSITISAAACSTLYSGAGGTVIVTIFVVSLAVTRAMTSTLRFVLKFLVSPALATFHRVRQAFLLILFVVVLTTAGHGSISLNPV